MVLHCFSLETNYKLLSAVLSTAKVVGTAIPKEPAEQWKAAWQLSTGDELMIGGVSSSVSGLIFCVKNQAAESTVGLQFLFLHCLQ